MQTPDVTETAAPSVAETLAKFGADDQRGLSHTEVQARLKKYGPNALVEKQTNAFAALLQYFWGPMPGMIEAAALMALIVGDWGDYYSALPKVSACCISATGFITCSIRSCKQSCSCNSSQAVISCCL
jgi:magnesium-transporting ATPase (P-type)